MSGSISMVSSMSAPCLIDIIPFADIEISDATPDFSAVLIMTSMKTTNYMLKQTPSMPWEYVLKLCKDPILKYSDADMKTIIKRIDTLQECINNKDSFAYIQRVYAAYTLLQTENISIHLSHLVKKGRIITNPNHEYICRQFTINVEEKVTIHHDAKYYANKLGISVQHLARITKSYLNVTPKEFIDYMLVSKILIAIKNTTQSLKEISYECGFSDPNSMLRFIRRNLGTNATKLRKDIESDTK